MICLNTVDRRHEMIFVFTGLRVENKKYEKRNKKKKRKRREKKWSEIAYEEKNSAGVPEVIKCLGSWSIEATI